MKKKFKVTLVVFLVVVLGCFSQVFAATNQNEKLSKFVKQTKSVKLLDSTNDNGVDQYTKLLMHMDDGAFKDECGNTVTNSNVTLDTTNKKFGEGSACFNGTNGELKIINSGIDLSSGDFTIDWWQYQLGYTGKYDNPIAIGKSGDTDTNWQFYVNCGTSGLNFTCGAGSSYVVDNSFFNTSLLPSLNTWHHMAIVKYGNVYTMYIDGNAIRTVTAKSSITKSIGNIYISGNGSSQYFNGYIDEFRISNVARWISNFTPPTAPYGNTLATGISLNKTTDSLIPNDSIKGTDTLIATVIPNSATNKTVKWTSSDPSIATVDSTGKVTALKSGTVTITATTTDGSNLSASGVVTVQDPEAGKSKLIIYMGNQVTREYYLTDDEINDFINWYDARANDKTPKSYYVFNVPAQGVVPARKDYVLFDKIKAFEVE